jgi:L-ascorbate metabolism protein UlaG (beta-lactamase superfamily)
VKPAWLKDEAFLADVRDAGRRPEELHLWWLGQSGFLLQHRGRHLLMDPYLSDSLTAKYAGTNKPHVRMTERVVAPERLGFVDAVTSSHNHTDHFDPETLRPLLEANPDLRLVVPEANRAVAAGRLGTSPERLQGLDDGGSLDAAGFVIHGLPSAHDVIETDPDGHHRYLGYIVECGQWRVYHSGDTRRYEGLEERLSAFRLDVGLLPINGWAPERRVAGNLSAREAVDVALGGRIPLVVPHHYDMFEFNTADPAVFETAAREAGLGFRTLRSGERLTLEPGRR